ncbi:hypothetical protein JCM10213_008247 [Rhodosporidiobolus nylandii]
MPAPSLPNELIGLIFEHLYRLLCVDPREDTLGVPQLASFVFHPFLFVNRNWHTLAKPFFYRHLPQELYHRGLTGDNLRTVQPFVKSATLRTKRVDWARSWATFVRPIGFVLEQLRVQVVRPVTGRSLLPCLLPRLRLFHLGWHEGDARLSGWTAIELLSDVATSCPQLEDLGLSLRLEGDVPVRQPQWRISRLRRLCVDLSGGPDGFLEQVIISCIVAPSAPILQTLLMAFSKPCVDFSRLFPFPFPRLRNLSLEHTLTHWYDPEFWASFPHLLCAELPVLPAADPSLLPPPPMYLQQLSLALRRLDDLDALVNCLLSLPLTHLTSLGLELHWSAEKYWTAEREDSEKDQWRANAARLLARCEEDNIRFHSDLLCTFFPSAALKELAPLAASHDLVVRYRGTPSRAGQDVGLSGPSRSAGNVEDDFEWLPFAASVETDQEGAAVGGEDSEGSGADSAEEYEDDWDAEDLLIFRGRWSREKCFAFDAERAFPNCSSHFASPEKFEAAKRAAVEAMRPFLRDDTEGRAGD